MARGAWPGGAWPGGRGRAVTRQESAPRGPCGQGCQIGPNFCQNGPDPAQSGNFQHYLPHFCQIGPDFPSNLADWVGNMAQSGKNLAWHQIREDPAARFVCWVNTPRSSSWLLQTTHPPLPGKPTINRSDEATPTSPQTGFSGGSHG